STSKPKMRILLTLPSVLFPADTGGKIRSLNIFSRLGKTAEFHAASFADPARDEAGVPRMKELFASYTPVFRSEAPKYSATFYSELLANEFSSWPYFLTSCNKPALLRAVEELAGRIRFDLIFCDFLHTAAPLRELTARPKIVFEHNVEFSLRKRKWKEAEHPLRRFVYGAEWRKTRRIEADVCRSFDHV